MLKLETASLDGTKVRANTSRHRAVLYEYPRKIEAKLHGEVADLMAPAEAADPGVCRMACRCGRRWHCRDPAHGDWAAKSDIEMCAKRGIYARARGIPKALWARAGERSGRQVAGGLPLEVLAPEPVSTDESLPHYGGVNLTD